MKVKLRNHLSIAYSLLHLSSSAEAQAIFRVKNQFLVSEDTALYFCRINNHTFTLQNSSQWLTAHLDSTLLDTISLSGAWMNTRISMDHNSNVLWVELHNIENPELRKQYFMDLDKKDFVNTFNNNIYMGQNFFELSGKHIYGGDFISNTQYVDVLPYISTLK